MSHITNIDFYFSISIKFFLESSKLTLTITLVNIKPLGSTHFYSYELLQPHGVGIGKEALQPGAEHREASFQAAPYPSPIHRLPQTLPPDSSSQSTGGIMVSWHKSLPRHPIAKGTQEYGKTSPWQTPKTSPSTSPPHTKVISSLLLSSKHFGAFLRHRSKLAHE